LLCAGEAGPPTGDRLFHVERAVTQRLVTVNFQLSPHVRRNTRDGHEYLVAPVVAVKEGVLNGELLLAKDIALSTNTWNGIPLPIDHPFENGLPISVNRADLLHKCVGHFEAVTFVDNALKGELWLNVGKTNILGGDAVTARQRLEGNLPLEVSTAYRCDIEPVSGEYNGIAYNGIQRNIQPDHLALLPNKKGACSWEHGCGAPRTNEQKESPVKNFLAAMKAKLFGQIEANIEQSFSDKRRAIHTALETVEMAGPNSTMMSGWVDLEDVYEDRVIYSVYVNGTADTQLYSRTYTLDDNGKATLGERSAVVKETRYLPMSETATNANGNTVVIGNATAPTPALKTNCADPAPEQHVNQEVPMEKKELVTNVLRIQKRPETERAAFEALPDEVLKTLSVEIPVAEPKKEEPVVTPAAAAQPDIAAIVSAAVKEALATVPTVNADAMHFFKQVNEKAAAHRGKLEEFITANSAYVVEELAGKGVGELEKIVSLIRPQANYGGRLMPSMTANTQQNQGVPDPPPWVEPKAA
jgi:hypothetical protein